MKQFKVWTDGSLTKNPGGRGCGAAIFENTQTGERKLLLTKEPKTTSNRIEMLAIIRPLELSRHPLQVTVYSDSEYLVLGWKERMRRDFDRNWRNHRGAFIANRDLWKRLYAQDVRHLIQMEWVRGHSGHPENELCDTLARAYLKNPANAVQLAENKGLLVIDLP